jgi:hypothetical protein
MKIVRNLVGFVAGISAIAVIVFAPASASAAVGSATFAVSPSAGSYTVGATVTINITESGSEADSARAQLSYSASTLEVVSSNFSMNAYNTCVTSPSAGNGSIDTGNCTVLGGKRTSSTLGQVTFKVKSTGTGSIAFTSKQAVNNGEDLSVSSSNASFTLNAAPVVDEPAPTGTAPTTKNTTTNNTNNKTATTTTTDGEVAGDETTAAETAKTEDDKKKDDTKKSDDKKDDSKDTSSSAWFWPVALVAVIAGYVAARTMRSRAAAKAAADTEAAAAAKAASDKPKNKKNKK